ncbi:hypothetical protein BJ684DRAFT_14330 [Piptocephalis cylindrospora]|uniref:SANT domain-containing protein n=1 Tax=Piptocephalis cylindrospora TaxID=1907219 RepID=A0A4P9Y9F0_9FUNG|nr:hypothetical protein BJ684DRAFT_14330 [Piptocephalis cylindrospora]|eukprot:RKP15422.1 hypothetical protein BJ684DRAFT_14330 [Piptocephalis cylindrospora]
MDDRGKGKGMDRYRPNYSSSKPPPNYPGHPAQGPPFPPHHPHAQTRHHPPSRDSRSTPANHSMEAGGPSPMYWPQPGAQRRYEGPPHEVLGGEDHPSMRYTSSRPVSPDSGGRPSMAQLREGKIGGGVAIELGPILACSHPGPLFRRALVLRPTEEKMFPDQGDPIDILQKWIVRVFSLLPMILIILQGLIEEEESMGGRVNIPGPQSDYPPSRNFPSSQPPFRKAGRGASHEPIGPSLNASSYRADVYNRSDMGGGGGGGAGVGAPRGNDPYKRDGPSRLLPPNWYRGSSKPGSDAPLTSPTHPRGEHGDRGRGRSKLWRGAGRGNGEGFPPEHTRENGSNHSGGGVSSYRRPVGGDGYDEAAIREAFYGVAGSSGTTVIDRYRPQSGPPSTAPHSRTTSRHSSRAPSIQEEDEDGDERTDNEEEDEEDELEEGEWSATGSPYLGPATKKAELPMNAFSLDENGEEEEEEDENDDDEEEEGETPSVPPSRAPSPKSPETSVPSTGRRGLLLRTRNGRTMTQTDALSQIDDLDDQIAEYERLQAKRRARQKRSLPSQADLAPSTIGPTTSTNAETMGGSDQENLSPSSSDPIPLTLADRGDTTGSSKPSWSEKDIYAQNHLLAAATPLHLLGYPSMTQEAFQTHTQTVLHQHEQNFHLRMMRFLSAQNQAETLRQRELWRVWEGFEEGWKKRLRAIEDAKPLIPSYARTGDDWGRGGSGDRSGLYETSDGLGLGLGGPGFQAQSVSARGRSTSGGVSGSSGPSNSRGFHNPDAVRSEAHLQEIMERLAREASPGKLIRAKQLSARIPDMLPPWERRGKGLGGVRYENRGSRILDPVVAFMQGGTLRGLAGQWAGSGGVMAEELVGPGKSKNVREVWAEAERTRKAKGSGSGGWVRDRKGRERWVGGDGMGAGSVGSASATATTPLSSLRMGKTWTRKEREAFVEAYLKGRKQFGTVASALPDRTTAECVLQYYREKKVLHLKAMAARKDASLRRRGGAGSRRSQAAVVTGTGGESVTTEKEPRSGPLGTESRPGQIKGREERKVDEQSKGEGGEVKGSETSGAVDESQAVGNDEETLVSGDGKNSIVDVSISSTGPPSRRRRRSISRAVKDTSGDRNGGKEKDRPGKSKDRPGKEGSTKEIGSKEAKTTGKRPLEAIDESIGAGGDDAAVDAILSQADIRKLLQGYGLTEVLDEVPDSGSELDRKGGRKRTGGSGKKAKLEKGNGRALAAGVEDPLMDLEDAVETLALRVLSEELHLVEDDEDDGEEGEGEEEDDEEDDMDMQGSLLHEGDAHDASGETFSKDPRAPSTPTSYDTAPTPHSNTNSTGLLPLTLPDDPQWSGAVSGSISTPVSSSSVPGKKPTFSSYWSKLERANFLHLLEAHGKDFSAIASSLGSKTAVQVKNYYHNHNAKLGLSERVASAQYRQVTATPGPSGIEGGARELHEDRGREEEGQGVGVTSYPGSSTGPGLPEADRASSVPPGYETTTYYPHTQGPPYSSAHPTTYSSTQSPSAALSPHLGHSSNQPHSAHIHHHPSPSAPQAHGNHPGLGGPTPGYFLPNVPGERPNPPSPPSLPPLTQAMAGASTYLPPPRPLPGLEVRRSLPHIYYPAPSGSISPAAGLGHHPPIGHQDMVVGGGGGGGGTSYPSSYVPMSSPMQATYPTHPHPHAHAHPMHHPHAYMYPYGVPPYNGGVGVAHGYAGGGPLPMDPRSVEYANYYAAAQARGIQVPGSPHGVPGGSYPHRPPGHENPPESNER